MIHLISVVGKSGRNFYLKQHYLSDFKALVQTITSGRVMLISTRFRSDLFYASAKPRNNSILKLWALYAKTTRSNMDRKEFTTAIGEEMSLTGYFQSIAVLSQSWHHYKLYKKAFRNTFRNDRYNPVAQQVVSCDQYLVEHKGLKRTPLLDPSEKLPSPLSGNTFSLAMERLHDDAVRN